MKKPLLTEIILLARALPEDQRVPYSFEKGIMARVRAANPEDVWSMWLPLMRRAAVCGLTVLALTGVYLQFTQNRPADLLAGDLERTVLASVHIDETW